MASTADPSARFCTSCRERVVDLSKLTRRQAEVVLRRGECVSAAYDDDGAVLFRPERRRLPLFPAALRAAAVAAPLWLMGCGDAGSSGGAEEHTEAPDRPVPWVRPVVPAAPTDDSEAACELTSRPPAAQAKNPRAPATTRPAHPPPYPRLAGRPAYRPTK